MEMLELLKSSFPFKMLQEIKGDKRKTPKSMKIGFSLILSVDIIPPKKLYTYIIREKIQIF